MGVAEIIALIGIAERLIKFIGEQRKTAGQSRKWTAEEKAEVAAKWNRLVNSKAWQTDEEGG